MSRVVTACALPAALLVLATAGGAAASSPQVHAAGKCHLTHHDQFKSGPSYLTSLSVRHTSCGTGKAVVRSYHKHHGHVSGYGCHRTIIDKSRFQYDARVTCKRGSKRVSFTYTQNT
jgi:hypothetical protein